MLIKLVQAWKGRRISSLQTKLPAHRVVVQVRVLLLASATSALYQQCAYPYFVPRSVTENKETATKTLTASLVLGVRVYPYWIW